MVDVTRKSSRGRAMVGSSHGTWIDKRVLETRSWSISLCFWQECIRGVRILSKNDSNMDHWMVFVCNSSSWYHTWTSPTALGRSWFANDVEHFNVHLSIWSWLSVLVLVHVFLLLYKERSDKREHNFRGFVGWVFCSCLFILFCFLY